MAKKVKQDESPFYAVDKNLVSAVMSAPQPAKEQPQEEKVIEVVQSRGGEEPRKAPKKQAIAEKMTVQKRFLFTQSEAAQMDRFATQLAAEVGTPIKFSHIVRAFLRLAQDSEKEILKAARRNPKLFRPANGDMKGIEEFERALAKIIMEGLE